ncbi:MAG: hypothetical protein JST30_17275 [Armatimonadetes bacterium]|nr:hypothetical protein [Armatimonadota bacterium]
MSAVLAAALVLSPQAVPGLKEWTLDDFTVGPYTITLAGGGTDNHGFSGLDRRHCVFGQRRTYVDINSNPNHTTLTLSVGNHEQRFDSPRQVAWGYDLQYGYDGPMSIDLSSVDRFLFDCDQIPDTPIINVRDAQGKSGGNGGWLLMPGGIYFRRQAFTGNVDWKHIVFLQYKQDFSSFPNPLSYSVTKFYARLQPGAIPPAARVP